MDGSNIKVALLLTLGLTLTGCSQEKSSEEVFPKATSQCEEYSSQSRFIAQWEDGNITYHEASNRQEILENLVEPNLPLLKRVEHDHKVIRHQERSQRLAESQYISIDNWGVNQTEAPYAWAQGYRGQGVVVAVIDSGVDRTHSALSNNIFVNPGETGVDSFGNNKSNNMIDDDGNGFVDDYAGWDFVMDSNYVYDDDAHGTHVAGTISAYHTDDVHRTGYVQGIAPEAKILPLDFITGVSGFISHAIEAIKYAALMNIDVINASWGGPACSQILEETIKGLSAKNILFVAASGNEGINIDQYPRYPASHTLGHLMSVGMIGSNLLMANRSNFGNASVSLFAPGVNIYSTVPGEGVASFSGTSMATPAVAAAAAVILSANPSLTPAQLKAILNSTTDFNANYRNQSRGRLNIRKAIQAL